VAILTIFIKAAGATTAPVLRNLTIPLVLLCCLATPALHAVDAPMPPCGNTPYPTYPEDPQQLHIAFWSPDQLPDPWQPPACSSWQPQEFSVLMAAAGVFHPAGGAQALLQRIAAVSQLAGLRYWSVTRDRWTILIEEAYALNTAEKSSRREDFSPIELQTGRDYFYWQREPTTSGSAVYGFRLLENTSQRIVVSVRNLSAPRHLGLKMLDVGEAQTLYIFERLQVDGSDAELWGYYQLTRLGHGLHDWLPVTEASYANRMSAVFRYFAGLSEDALPVSKD
jgi:hypothetical protein